MDTITIAKFLSAPAAFIASGYSLGFSQNTVPLVYSQPASVSTAVFRGVFYQGAVVAVSTALISASASGYLAYQLPEHRPLFATASGLSLSWLAWTQLVMGPGINRLLEIGAAGSAELQKADQTGEVTKLLKAWVAQNYVRAGLAFVAGYLSLYAAYSITAGKGKQL